jgi:uncharacterized membrane protein
MESGPKSYASMRRINNLDAARGAAMVLVCLSHFTAVYFRNLLVAPPGQVPKLPWEIAVGMIASPTFIAISGTLLGLLFVMKRDTFARLRIKLIDRALFVLTVAHVLIACSRLTFESNPEGALRMTFMTDTIGVCVILGSWLITVTSRSMRAVLGVACYALGWKLLYSWAPHTGFEALIKDIFIGGMPIKVLGYSVPILPWFGMYIACTALGEYLGDYYRASKPVEVERGMLTAGLAMLAGGLMLRCLGWTLTAYDMFGAKSAEYWRLFFSPWSKLPPSPTYALFFGGIGMLLIWGLTRASHQQRFQWLVAQLATIGRTSLAVFTLQYYVYYIGLDNLPIARTSAWPLLYVASLALLLAFARWWDRRNYNVVLTVGLPWILEALGRVPSVRVATSTPRSASPAVAPTKVA